MVPSALAAGVVSATEAAAVLHSGGPKSTSVTCTSIARSRNVFFCKVHLVKAVQGHRCVSAMFMVPDRNIRHVQYDQGSLAFCDAAK